MSVRGKFISVVMCAIVGGILAVNGLPAQVLEFSHGNHGPVTRDVKGLIVGTNGGLYIIGRNSSEKIRVTLKTVYGVAFDWSSEKIYWSENDVGLMRANVDGSDFEQLLVDHYVVGVGIEPITGNLYYGSLERNSLRVCDNDGKKCSTIARQTGRMYDIAFHPSKGFLFWSIQGLKTVRSNLDGSNVTEIMHESSYGLSVDESEDRVYLATGRSLGGIVTCDVDGNNVRTIRASYIDPNDVEVDGSKVYYSSVFAENVRYIGKQSTSANLVASFPSPTRHIALFGEQVPPTRSNPCAKAQCTHLCVLITASSYRCLCPDGKRLQKDGISCSI